MGHYVYKYVYDGEVVYIGKNDTDLISRINQHKLEEKFKQYMSSYIYYIELENKYDTDIMETLLINKYLPKLNIAKKAEFKSEINFVEPEWKRYFEEDFRKPTIKGNEVRNEKISQRALKKRKEKQMSELEAMLTDLWFYQYLSFHKPYEKDGELFIEVPINPDYLCGSIDSKYYEPNEKCRGWTSLSISATRKPGSFVVTYKLFKEGYEIFMENYKEIIKGTKEEIRIFVEQSVLDVDVSVLF